MLVARVNLGPFTRRWIRLPGLELLRLLCVSASAAGRAFGGGGGGGGASTKHSGTVSSTSHSVARATKANPVAKMTCYINLFTGKISVYECTCAHACVCVCAAVIEMQSPDANGKSFLGDSLFGHFPPSHRDIYPGSRHQYTPALQPQLFCKGCFL